MVRLSVIGGHFSSALTFSEVGFTRSNCSSMAAENNNYHSNNAENTTRDPCTANSQGKRRKLGPSITLPAPVYLVGAARTPHGAFQGKLSHLTAVELGSFAINAALEMAGVEKNMVNEVFMGNVCSANLGQAPARQASLMAGLPKSVDATTINKVCSSGLKAIVLGAQSVALGENDVVIGGGMESMSNVPHYIPTSRRGNRLGNTTLVDGLLRDGLMDATYGIHMGECAELCAEKHSISREEQDVHAIESAEKAKKSIADGTAAWEIVPVPKSEGFGYINDDEPLEKMNPEKLRRLKPYFAASDSGTVTAGNASPISDGAAAVVLASEGAVKQLNLRPLACIVSYADAALDPKEFPEAPAFAALKALERANLSPSDVDCWEINEAFSVVDLVNRKLLNLDPAKLNVFGGAVAIGHPIGASGARLVVTLLNALRIKGGTIGVAAICNGGGGSSAIVIKRMNDAP